MKNDIKVKKRLLTKPERDSILKIYENNNKNKMILVKYLLLLILTSILCGFYYYMYGILGAIGFFVIINGYSFGIIISQRLSVKKQIKQIKLNELYVEEAIYERLDKYGTGYFKMARRSSLYAAKAILCEPNIRSGDKVILIQKKGQVWVYKARG